MSNRASSRCSKNVQVLMCPSSSSAVLTLLPHLATASNSPRGLRLFSNGSHVPVGNHISSFTLNIDHTPEQADKWHAAISGACACSRSSCHGWLWRNHASHIKNRLCVFLALILFSLFTQNIPPLLFFFLLPRWIYSSAFPLGYVSRMTRTFLIFVVFVL